MFYNNTYESDLSQKELIKWSVQKKQETITGIGSVYKYKVESLTSGFKIHKNR